MWLFANKPAPRAAHTYELVGNIGVGKTSLGRALVPLVDDFVEERVEPRLLAAFVAEPQRFGFALQLRMLGVRQADARTSDRVRLLDRSLLGDYVFAAANYAASNFDEYEFAIYRECAGGSLADVLRAQPHTTYVYLRDDAAACQARLRARDGVDARETPLDYLRVLEAAHELAIVAAHEAKARVVELTWPDYQHVASDSNSIAARELFRSRLAPDVATKRLDADARARRRSAAVQELDAKTASRLACALGQ